MHHSGVPLLRSLEILEQQSSHATVAAVLQDVRQEVADGNRLAEAIEKAKKEAQAELAKKEAEYQKREADARGRQPRERGRVDGAAVGELQGERAAHARARVEQFWFTRFHRRHECLAGLHGIAGLPGHERMRQLPGGKKVLVHLRQV